MSINNNDCNVNVGKRVYFRSLSSADVPKELFRIPNANPFDPLNVLHYLRSNCPLIVYICNFCSEDICETISGTDFIFWRRTDGHFEKCRLQEP